MNWVYDPDCRCHRLTVDERLMGVVYEVEDSDGAFKAMLPASLGKTTVSHYFDSLGQAREWVKRQVEA